MDLGIGIDDGEAEEWRNKLAREEDLYVGYSSAANVCGAAKLLHHKILGTDAAVSTILRDTGLKY